MSRLALVGLLAAAQLGLAIAEGASLTIATARCPSKEAWHAGAQLPAPSTQEADLVLLDERLSQSRAGRAAASVGSVQEQSDIDPVQWHASLCSASICSPGNVQVAATTTPELLMSAYVDGPRFRSVCMIMASHAWNVTESMSRVGAPAIREASTETRG